MRRGFAFVQMGESFLLLLSVLKNDSHSFTGTVEEAQAAIRLITKKTNRHNTAL